MFFNDAHDDVQFGAIEVDASSDEIGNVTWQWKTSSGWKDYDRPTSNAIEKAYQGQELICSITTLAGEYQVSIVEMVQRSVRDTKLTRQVRRVDPTQVEEEVHTFTPLSRKKRMFRHDSQLAAALGKGKGRASAPWLAKGQRALMDTPQFGTDAHVDNVFGHLMAFQKGKGFGKRFQQPSDQNWLPTVDDPFNLFMRPESSEAESRAAMYRLALQKARKGQMFHICEAVRKMNPKHLGPELDAVLVGAAQQLVNGTYKSIWTHDRKTRAKHNDDRPEDTPTGFQVISVEVVIDESMRAKYQSAKSRICQDDPVLDLHIPATAKYAGESVKKECNEWMLYHGTSPQNAQSIRTCNFKLLNSKAANEKLLCGAGFYFTESPTKADEYASPENPGDDRIFLLCRVLGGRVHYTEEDSPDRNKLKSMLQNATCNSVLNDREQTRGTYKEFLVVRPEQVLPECLIKYRPVY